MDIKSTQNHWNNIYDSSDRQTLGWYEDIPKVSLDLISQCNIEKHDIILDVGCGSSSLIKSLLIAGFYNLVGTDISKTAIDISRELSGADAKLVKWIVDDITNSLHISDLTNVKIWHDRAVLHFLLDNSQRQSYLDLINKVLCSNGYVIISTFSLKGARKCSGLDVINYDQKMLADFLGDNYKMLKYIDYNYTQPSGNIRPYISTLFQRIKY